MATKINEKDFVAVNVADNGLVWDGEVVSTAIEKNCGSIHSIPASAHRKPTRTIANQQAVWPITNLCPLAARARGKSRVHPESSRLLGLWPPLRCPRAVLCLNQTSRRERSLYQQQLQEELNKNLFNNLIEFLQKSHSGFQKNSRDWTCQIKLKEIPTAALVLGVNVTDHDLIFRSLTEALQNNITPYVVSLQAKDCPDMKHFLQKLVSQLMDCSVDIKFKEGESVQSTQKKTHCSMDSLSSWYMSVTQKTDPKMPSKKRTTSSQWQSPPVVLILKDMESFTTKVLQDFIIISSQHLHEFPLILVFGIATSPVIIHRLLPHAVSSLLCIELFQSLSCKEHLTTVLDKLLLTTQFPFKISEKVLQVLTNIFLYHDFSIQNFVKGLQLSLLEHFYSQPLSVLCCSLPEAKRRINFLSVNQCENIRRLPSFRRYVEKQASEKQVALLTNDRFLKIRELYCTCLEKNIWDSEEYASVLQLLRMFSKDELMTMLQKSFRVFNSSSENQLGSTVKRIEEFLAQFQNLGDVKEEEDASGSQPKGLPKTDLYHLQKSLLEMKELRRSSKKQTKFELLREKVVNFIDSLVREYLLPPETQPLNEVVYFSAAHTLREHLNAAPRIALHTALNNPYYYLKNEALKSEEGCIPNIAPDICIAYKLHLECSRLINLVDWSEAFATVVTAAENMDGNSVASEEMNEIIHARFIRAVSELELLGFIKPTKQKTDHVARLTWGGC
ncbi:Origin recognition complex subunit 3 [Heterocephalus glaber]|uniref:Origin recognition complex subunit 3 n=1 Tax=Heterocephalus glaber TaxID=10181 RepID=G5B6Y6_HETGA|nr:Origin recognition complex subunit 3 [Heterocephalus glaber]